MEYRERGGGEGNILRRLSATGFTNYDHNLVFGELNGVTEALKVKLLSRIEACNVLHAIL